MHGCVLTESARWQYKVGGKDIEPGGATSAFVRSAAAYWASWCSAASGSPAPTHAATIGTATVSVVVNDEDPQTIDLAAVDPDVGPIDDYPYQSPADPHGTTDIAGGVSITRLIQLAGADPAAVTRVEVTNPATGLPVVLIGEEVRQPSSFLDQLPAVFLDQTEAGFLRPLRTEDDMNADDAFTAPVGEELQVHVWSPSPLEVHARVSATTTTVGKPVTFFVTARGGVPGEVLKAHWRFGDGQRARSAWRDAAYLPARTYLPRDHRHRARRPGIRGLGHDRRADRQAPTAGGRVSGNGGGGSGNGGTTGDQGGVAGSTTGGTQPTYTYDPPTYGNGASPTTPTPTTQPTDPGQTVTGTVLGSDDQTAATNPTKNGFSGGDSASTEHYTRLGAAAIGVALLSLGAFRELPDRPQEGRPSG